ncbi:hypothetical protein CDL15_Pgr015177 [Punica granatum]|uniref:Uncharacterized protein n=1 Tax=Punica granatum TaxID=22663 RepID=A0A218VZM3_PUNGR|nr:hypothetical protein CDL15_Pgr015177 [Punica granatum]
MILCTYLLVILVKLSSSCFLPFHVCSMLCFFLCVFCLRSQSGIPHDQFSPADAALVATGGGDDRGFLWKIGQGDWALEIQGLKDSVSSLAFSNDRQLLASGSFDGFIQIRNVSLGNVKGTLEGSYGGIEWVKWHPRGPLVLAGSEDATVWMWNADNKSAYFNIFSGKTICTGCDDAAIRIWNPKTGEIIHVVRGLTCLTISSDSNLAITGAKDSSVHIVNIASGKVANSLAAHSDSIECVGIAPRFLATGCVDGKVRVWDSLSGDCVRTFNVHSDAIQSLSVSANKEFLVSVTLDGTARVFRDGRVPVKGQKSIGFSLERQRVEHGYLLHSCL